MLVSYQAMNPVARNPHVLVFQALAVAIMNVHMVKLSAGTPGDNTFTTSKGHLAFFDQNPPAAGPGGPVSTGLTNAVAVTTSVSADVERPRRSGMPHVATGRRHSESHLESCQVRGAISSGFFGAARETHLGSGYT